MSVQPSTSGWVCQSNYAVNNSRKTRPEKRGYSQLIPARALQVAVRVRESVAQHAPLVLANGRPAKDGPTFSRTGHAPPRVEGLRAASSHECNKAGLTSAPLPLGAA